LSTTLPTGAVPGNEIPGIEMNKAERWCADGRAIAG